MNFSQHARAGLTASAFTGIASFFYYQKIDQPLLIGLVTFIGSIFPDLDTESIPSRWTARIGFICSLILLYNDKPTPVAIVGTLFFLVKSDKHRGFIHKYWFAAVFIIAGLLWSNPLCLAFGVGLIVHYTVDGITPAWKNWF